MFADELWIISEKTRVPSSHMNSIRKDRNQSSFPTTDFSGSVKPSDRGHTPSRPANPPEPLSFHPSLSPHPRARVCALDRRLVEGVSWAGRARWTRPVRPDSSAVSPRPAACHGSAIPPTLPVASSGGFCVPFLRAHRSAQTPRSR